MVQQVDKAVLVKKIEMKVVIFMVKVIKVMKWFEA